MNSNENFHVPSTMPSTHGTETPDITRITRKDGVHKGSLSSYYDGRRDLYFVDRATRAEAIRLANSTTAQAIVEEMRAANAAWVEASLAAAPLNFSGPNPDGGTVPYQAAPAIPEQKQRGIGLLLQQAELYGAALEVRLDRDQNPSAL